MKQIDEMFSYADKNMDGKLSFSEFEVRSSLIIITLNIIHVSWPGDDEAPDPARDCEAARHRHRDDAATVQSPGRHQAGEPVKLRLSHSPGLKGDILIQKLSGEP